MPQDEFDLGTNKCATVTIGAGAPQVFSAYGITFQNDYNVVDHTAAGEQTPAVALNTQADKVYLKNSRIIGRQDTLYV
ncbi:pectinesterase family protein [Bifidobacterium longum]|uniref:pectinesterase family protein n=1 Tax=Bifidobacterium longum TaxID=216816 RepID=UPI000A880A08|nr:pectinesterase family protein [Bifidobacterium longum]